MNPRVPHLRVVISVTAFVLVGFSLVSAYVLVYSDDEVTKGNIIGTWQNFALLGVGFWLGSSSAGKASREQVEVVNPPDRPVPTTPGEEP